MNKTWFSTCALIAVMVIPANLWARFALGFDVDYMSQTYFDSSGSSSGSAATGYGLYPSLRYEFPVIAPIAVGVGAYAAYGSASPAATNGVTSDTITGIAYGGDIWIILDTGLRIKPYARVMLGRASLEEKVAFTNSLGYYSATTEGSGFQYNFLGGVRLPVLPLVELYVQGGYAGVGNQSQSLMSFTLNGVPVSNVTTNGQNTYSSGFLIGGGLMLLF